VVAGQIRKFCKSCDGREKIYSSSKGSFFALGNPVTWTFDVAVPTLKRLSYFVEH